MVRWVDYETSQETGLPEGVYVHCHDRDFWQYVGYDYGATMIFHEAPKESYSLTPDSAAVAVIRKKFSAVREVG